MSRASVAPGRRSLEGLEWLARVGASPLEPWGLVMGWCRAVTYDHARRLAEAGLVRTVRMTRGNGSLVVVTAAGAARAGYPANRALRSVAPSMWAHASACAWVSAWLRLRGHQWWSEHEILDDAFWRRDVRYRDHRGTARITHRPDLALQIAGRPAAIEVELQRKTRARLVGILGMYAEHSDSDDGALYGVLYVCDRDDVADAVKRAAIDAGLHAPAISFRTLHGVVEQTRAAARTREAAGRDAVGATRLTGPLLRYAPLYLAVILVAGGAGVLRHPDQRAVLRRRAAPARRARRDGAACRRVLATVVSAARRGIPAHAN